jgi:two-component system, sensor histidine kinase
MPKLAKVPVRSGMLHDLSMLVSQPFLTLDACLPVMLPVITRHLGVSAAFVSEFTPGNLNFLGAVDQSDSGLLSATAEPILESFCQYVYATGAPMVIGDASLDVRVQAVGLRSKFSIGAYIGVPIIRSSGAIYGTLCALDPQPRQFSDDHMAFLRVLASKLAWVIERPAAGADRPAPPAPDQPGADPSLLLRILAHDIRSPLTSILGYCEMLKSGMVGPLSADQQSLIVSIDEASRFIHRLATDMVASVDSLGCTISLLVDRYDPGELARRVASIYQAQAAAKGLELTVRIGSPLLEGVGDAVRVQHALSNLVANAIHYTDRGGVSLAVSADAETIVYAVSDTGCGIAEPDQARIWSLHARACADRPGHGIGLYMVRQLVEAMHGSVTVESAPGQGSTFIMRMPRLVHPESVSLGFS